MRKKAVGLVPLAFALGCDNATVPQKTEKAQPAEAPQISHDRHGDVYWENGSLVIADPDLAAKVRAYCQIAPGEAATVQAQIRFGGRGTKEQGDRTLSHHGAIVDARC